MVNVELTPHLFTFFPQLRGQKLCVEAHNVAEVVRALDELAPGLAFYLCDERGTLRPHVNVFIGEERIIDRTRLTDQVDDGARVSFFQALSGG